MGLTDTVKGIFKPTEKRQSYPGTRATYNYAAGTGHTLYKRTLEYSGKKLGYKQVKKIMEDPQVKVAYDILNYFLLSKSYIVTSASDDDKDIEIKEFIEETLDNLNFRRIDKNLNTAIIYGNSVNEIIYGLNNTNQITITDVLPLHQRTLQNNPFIYDDNGELTGIHQESDYGTADIDIDKILLYSFDDEFDEVEGHSILSEIADYTNDKKNILNWLLTFLHKHENPTIFAKVAKGSVARKIRQALDAISGGKTNITIGPEDELGILESSHRGDTFFKSLTLFDNYIFRRFYLGNLLLGDPSQTGSYSQSDTQFKMSMNILNGIQEDKAAAWQEKIDQLVLFNFGVNAKSPKFKYESFIEKDYLNLIAALKDLVSNGVIDENAPWWKELIATAVQAESGVKVDTNNVTGNEDETDEGVDFGYQPPLPGNDEAEELVDALI